MSRFRALCALLSMAALACSSDKPTSPSDPLATRLNEIADSAGHADYRVSSALYAAAAVVRAGGRVTPVQLVIDSQPAAFSAVAMRVTYSRAACDQLKDMFGVYEGDTASYDFAAEMCRPLQSVIAWEGDDMDRIVIVQGDTGSSRVSVENYESWNFWAELYDRNAKQEWWVVSGRQTSGMIADRGACRAVTMPEEEHGIDFGCRLASLRHGFDLVLEQYDIIEYEDVDSVMVRKPSLELTDSIPPSDTAIYWEPGPTHTVAMRATTLDGLNLQIMRFEIPDRDDSFARRSALRGARLNRARGVMLR